MPRRRSQDGGLNSKQIGERLRARRLQLKLSQGALSKLLDISFQQIQKYEKGANSMNAQMMQSMCKALDVPVGYFFEDSGPASQSEFAILAKPGAITLLTAFAQIKKQKWRQHLIRAATLMAEG